jgi:hypothetical protein
MGCPTDIITIQKTECIGNSLNTINGNFNSLKTEVCDNQLQINNLFNNIETVKSNLYPLNLISGFDYEYTNTSTITIKPGKCVLNDLQTVITTTTNILLNTNSTNVPNGLQSSVQPNTAYYLYIIYNLTNNTIAAFASTVSIPVLPTGFTLYRLIGTFCTKSDSTIRNFFQKGRSNYRKLFFNDIGLTTASPLGYLFSGNNLVLAGDKLEPVPVGSGNAKGYTINLTPLILKNNFIHSAFISFHGLNLAGFETAYRIGARFTGTTPFMIASCNYNGVSNGQYDIQGELPLNMFDPNSTDLEIWYSQNTGSNQKQDIIFVYCHGLTFEI